MNRAAATAAARKVGVVLDLDIFEAFTDDNIVFFWIAVVRLPGGSVIGLHFDAEDAGE